MDYPTILALVSEEIKMFTKQVIIGGCSQYIELHTALSYKDERDGLDLQFHFCFTIDFDTYMLSHHNHPLVGVYDFMYILQHSADHRISIFRM